MLEFSKLQDAKIVQDKLAFSGASSLTDVQLLAIILGRGDIKEQYLEKSSILLKGNLTLDDIFSNDIEVRKISSSPAVQNLIKATTELSLRLKKREVSIETLKTSEDVLTLMTPLFIGVPTEQFWVIALNRASRIIDKQCLSQGGTHTSVVDIKLLLKYPINHLASSIILVHNHPSGSCQPSIADKEVTAKIDKAVGYLDIKLLDHIIIGNGERYSFRENGELE